jgi:hypothetical protein
VREAFGVGGKGGDKRPPSMLEDVRSAAEVYVGGRQPHERAVMVLVVVPRKLHRADIVRVLVAAEAIGEFGSVLQRLEVRFAEGVVVRHMVSVQPCPSLTTGSLVV